MTIKAAKNLATIPCSNIFKRYRKSTNLLDMSTYHFKMLILDIQRHSNGQNLFTLAACNQTKEAICL